MPVLAEVPFLDQQRPLHQLLDRSLSRLLVQLSEDLPMADLAGLGHGQELEFIGVRTELGGLALGLLGLIENRRLLAFALVSEFSAAALGFLGPVPHVPQLARQLALSPPTYQGVTGLIGVLHAELERAGVPTISLRVGVPHYLAHSEHPQAVTALIGHLAHVLGVTLPVDLSDDIERWGALHDEAVAEDDQLRGYVRMLEIEYDRRAEATLRSGDDLAALFEEFLRQQRDE